MIYKGIISLHTWVVRWVFLTIPAPSSSASPWPRSHWSGRYPRWSASNFEPPSNPWAPSWPWPRDSRDSPGCGRPRWSWPSNEAHSYCDELSRPGGEKSSAGESFCEVFSSFWSWLFSSFASWEGSNNSTAGREIRGLLQGVHLLQHPLSVPRRGLHRLFPVPCSKLSESGLRSWPSWLPSSRGVFPSSSFHDAGLNCRKVVSVVWKRPIRKPLQQVQQHRKICRRR